jgi:hypothetical protein
MIAIAGGDVVIGSTPAECQTYREESPQGWPCVVVDYQPLDTRAVDSCRQPLPAWPLDCAAIGAAIHTDMIVSRIERPGVERGWSDWIDRERCDGRPANATGHQPTKLPPPGRGASAADAALGTVDAEAGSAGSAAGDERLGAGVIGRLSVVVGTLAGLAPNGIAAALQAANPPTSRRALIIQKNRRAMCICVLL